MLITNHIHSVYLHLAKLIKIAVPLLIWPIVEVHSVIRYLNVKNITASDIHQEYVSIYGQIVISKKQAWFWCNIL
jgi:hypothetical protein